ncbi:hypothetical protein [Streptomyces formicae]|uniref:hypothetical protein n=1 Tax=Streptomyces formicae TaxID=1616117 RepID=UPI0036121DF1
MTRQLRKVGTNSGNNGCPTLYETEGGTYVVQGDRVTDPAELAQLDKPHRRGGRRHGAA